MPDHRLKFVRPLSCRRHGRGFAFYAIAQQPPSPTRVRGTIEAVDGDMIAVKSRSGEDFKLRMAGDMRLVGITKISLSDIKVGSFIGTTTVPGRTAARTRSRSMCFRRRCAAPARARGPSICAPTRP